MSTRTLCAMAILSAAILSPIAAQATGGKQATPIEAGKVAAKVKYANIEVIYTDNLKASFDELEKSAKGYKMTSKDKLSTFVQKINYVLFKQYGESQSIKIDDAEVAASLADVKKQPGATDAAIQASLLSQGILIDPKSYFREQMIFERYVKTKRQGELDAAGKYAVSEFMKAYDDMKYDLRQPDLLKFSMIFVNLQGKSDADKTKAQAMMESMSKQLKVNPSLFDELLIKGIIDPSLGYLAAPSATIYKTVESKKQNAAIYDAAFNMKEGQISDLVSDATRICIMRAGQFLPEKQLGLTDSIANLPSNGAVAYVQSVSAGATVLDLVAYELRSSKTEAFNKKIKDEVFAEIKKKATITITLANLSGILDPAEIESLKAMKGEYNITFE